MGPRISASFAAAAIPFLFVFSIPAIGIYLMVDQIYGTLAMMIKNFGYVTSSVTG